MMSTWTWSTDLKITHHQEFYIKREYTHVSAMLGNSNDW